MRHGLFGRRDFGAFLFDMDGTILTSIAAAERVWAAWATRHGVDVPSFLPTIHGRRASETIGGLGLPGIDVAAEARWVVEAELDDVGGIEPIAGAPEFLASIPSGSWAVVTSAPRPLAKRRLQAAGLPLPPLIIAGEDVQVGKPAPDGFLLGARQLGQRPQDCLVFEDAPAGIAAGEAAGATLAVITATHHRPMETTHLTLASYVGLEVRQQDGRLTIARADRRTAVAAGD